MKPGRLFWKIFFWYWSAMLIMAATIVLVMSQVFEWKEGDLQETRAKLRAANAERVTNALTTGGARAATVLLSGHRREMRRILVFDAQGQELLGRMWWKKSKRTKTLDKTEVTDPSGKTFTIVTFTRIRTSTSLLQRIVPSGLPPYFARQPEYFAIRFGLAVVLSALVCAWLAWYLTRPVKLLSHATKVLAEGDLATRVGHRLGGRRDEIVDLALDFDRMAERLQTSINAQKQLLSDASHELRSPLARMHIALGIARRQIGDQDAAVLSRIEREAKRLDDLVSEILTLARLQDGKTETLEDYIDLDDLLREIARDAEFEGGREDKRIRIESTQPATIRGNSELMHRALENLVRNALSHSPPGGTVDILLARTTPGCEIRICDRGSGVQPGLLDKIFEPFVRADQSRARKTGGYGLGLSISKKALNVHGADIRAENRDGGGLCVVVDWPQSRLSDDAC